MKKLFVMFLLLALVPFTTGCNLFGGDDDDTTTLAVTKLTASAILPASAGANLRAVAAVATKFAKVTMTINGLPLTATTEETLDGGLTYTVNFERVVSAAEYASATTGIVPVTLTKADGTLVNFAMDYSNLTAPLAVTISAAGLVTTAAGTVYADGKFVTVSSITGATDTLNPTFIVKFSGDIGSINNPTVFDVKVVKGTTTVAAATTDFNTSYIADPVAKTYTMTVGLINKTLVDGQTYTVMLNKIVSSTGVAVLAKNHTFTVALVR